MITTLNILENPWCGVKEVDEDTGIHYHWDFSYETIPGVMNWEPVGYVHCPIFRKENPPDQGMLQHFVQENLKAYVLEQRKENLHFLVNRNGEIDTSGDEYDTIKFRVWIMPC